MKLKTELIEGRHFGKPKDYVHYKAVTDVEHDALAAHALMQAMEEKAAEYSLAALALMIGPIKKRADELMREWTGQ